MIFLSATARKTINTMAGEPSLSTISKVTIKIKNQKDTNSAFDLDFSCLPSLGLKV